MLIVDTQGSYNTYLYKLVECLGVSDISGLTAEVMTDSNVAEFLLALAETMDYKPLAKKSGCAAVNYKLSLLGIRSIYDDVTIWPKSRALSKSGINA